MTEQEEFRIHPAVLAQLGYAGLKHRDEMTTDDWSALVKRLSKRWDDAVGLLRRATKYISEESGHTEHTPDCQLDPPCLIWAVEKHLRKKWNEE